MEVFNLPVDCLREATWNSNRMDETMTSKLRMSIARFGLVENLVVRPLCKNAYEVLSGNHRLRILKEMHFKTVPCVVVDLNDARARLLAQALNRVQGEDDLGLKAEIVKKILATLPKEEVLNILPETAGSLKALTSLNQDDIANYLQKWQQAQNARLVNLQFRLNRNQMEVVQEALEHKLPEARKAKGDNPNSRGIALYLLCKDYLEKEID
jgi:ParB family transcriptional regulator, chromosome partitioning protein